MESLQYLKEFLKDLKQLSFKPYYNWNTFNTYKFSSQFLNEIFVLNLIITGIPSIRKGIQGKSFEDRFLGFKPYYNWNTFNTRSICN